MPNMGIQNMGDLHGPISVSLTSLLHKSCPTPTPIIPLPALPSSCLFNPQLWKCLMLQLMSFCYWVYTDSVHVFVIRWCHQSVTQQLTHMAPSVCNTATNTYAQAPHTFTCYVCLIHSQKNALFHLMSWCYWVYTWLSPPTVIQEWWQRSFQVI